MNKRKRVLAEIIYFNKICGQKLGDKYIYFRVWTDKNRKSRLEQLMQNLIPINIFHLDDEVLERIRELLKNDKSINSSLAFASTYKHLVNYLEDCGDTPDMFNIKTMITSSEIMDMHFKRRIKEVIDCKIIDRYSNEENGIIAQTGDLSDEFNVNTASYYVELLRLDSDEETEVGETGRIVVTDLYNFAMPMIRYDTGDTAVDFGKEYGQIRQFKSLQGRQVDVIYDTRGSRITPLVLGAHLWGLDKLKQYQLIQEDAKKYVFKANDADGVYSKQVLDKIVRNILGQDAEIDIQFVDTIPVLASGKFKRTVCNYKP
jgi:phenylacetate-CoA ligase